MTTKLQSSKSYTIGWISVLPIERAAATALLDQHHDPPHGFVQHPSDTNSYTWGRMSGHNVVVASLPAGVYGTAAASTTASCLLASMPHIRIGLLVGTGGGIPRPISGRDIRLGDVVVSQPEGTTGGVIQHDLGKALLNEVWEPKGMLNMPPQVLLSALLGLQAAHELDDPLFPRFLKEMLQADAQTLASTDDETLPSFKQPGLEHDRLFESSSAHVEGNETCQNCDTKAEIKHLERPFKEAQIHYGVIASGNTLIKDAIARDNLYQRSQAPFLCLEMEAAGLMNHFPCLVIRGISNYADSHSNDMWQGYASATAAAFAKEFLRHVPHYEED